MSVEPLAFGPFRLNSENGTLLRDGELVPVGQKGALILARLLANPGEVTTKAQLVDAAWPGLSIEESNLSVQIAALRKALGEAPGGGEWIVPVARRLPDSRRNGRGGATDPAPTVTRSARQTLYRRSALPEHERRP